MKIEIEQKYLLDAKRINKLPAELKIKAIDIVRKSMKTILENGKKELSADIANNLKFRRKGSIVTGKLYDKYKDSMPQLHFYSRVPWLGQHEEGGAIKNTIISNTVNRIKYTELKTVLDTLFKDKNLQVEHKPGITLFYANNTKEHSKLLSKFKKKAKIESGKNIKKNERVLVAYKYSKITNKKKINFAKIVEKQADDLRALLVTEFRKQENKDLKLDDKKK